MSYSSINPEQGPRSPLRNLPINVNPTLAMGSPRREQSTANGRKRSFDELEPAVSSNKPMRSQYAFLRAPLRSNIRDAASLEGAQGPPGNGPPLWKEAEATFDGSDLQESDPSSPTQRSDLENSMISQQTAATELSQPPPSVADSAELLRLRLRIAMFKVKTGQACIPLSRVEVAHSSRKCASQSLLPPPPLKPTTFSARVVPNPQALSSPPRSASASPELGLTHEGFKTPALPRPKARVSEAVLSSPPDSLGGKEMTDQMEKENIPSSVIKKDAAQCLLGLSQALSSSAS